MFRGLEHNVKWGMMMPPSWEVRVPAVKERLLLMPPVLGFEITWECHLFKKVLQITRQRGLQWFKNSASFRVSLRISRTNSFCFVCDILIWNDTQTVTVELCGKNWNGTYSSLEVVSSVFYILWRFFFVFGDQGQNLGLFLANSVHSEQFFHQLMTWEANQRHIYFSKHVGAWHTSPPYHLLSFTDNTF